MIRQSSSTDRTLIALAALGGSLILFFPVHKLLLAFVLIAAFIYLVANPKICYYLVLILSTSAQENNFKQADALITICFIGVLFKILFVDKLHASLKTKIDLWLIALLIIYFVTGMISISPIGYRGFLQFGEVAAFFYITVYFLRTKTIKLSTLIKVILFCGLTQACLGIIQSITGGFGANFQSPRGYLGYLGIGSSLVWHGKGTFPHFNTLGPFLTTIFLFYLPINYFIVKNKRAGYIILAILFFGIITTYSRGSLIALFAGVLFFVYQIQKNKTGFLLKTAPFALLIASAWKFLKNTAYTSTLSPRNEMWDIALSVVATSPKAILIGSGLRSYMDAAFPYIPTNVPLASMKNYMAHSFYLYNAVEMGLLGVGFLVLFFIKNLFAAFKNLASRNKLLFVLGIAVISIMFSVLAESIFDIVFNLFVFQLWLLLILGIMYSKMEENKNLKRRNSG